MEFILVNRRTAEKEFKKGAEVYIGYEHKHDGAFYSRSQFPNLTFDEFRAKVKATTATYPPCVCNR